MAKKANNTASLPASPNLTQEHPMVSESSGLAKVSEAYPLQVVDMGGATIPDLEDAQEIAIDLMADYWTPENKGESKRVYFDCIKDREVRDQQNQDIVVTLPCAFFFEKEKGQPARTISNGSKRLVGLMENMQIKRGTPLIITYMGKKKNVTNNFQSDIWSVRPLIVNIK